MFKKITGFSSRCWYSTTRVPVPLRSRKPKSGSLKSQNFVDLKCVRVLAGNGGHGCVSFLHLWSNEYAGPDGGDGGSGAHVILKASSHITDLAHVQSVLKASDGEKGSNKDCNGKNAQHLVVDVPVGTVIKNGAGTVVGDLREEGVLFVAARGGAGGKGNHFFVSDTEQSPEICEYGGDGEDLQYTVELRSTAHIGLIGFPNAGKSTLLRAVSRARPKVAPYPFTTLKPHLGIVTYDDHEQIAVADLPGLMEESHKNKGLGIQFLRHIERCSLLIYVLDMTTVDAAAQLSSLRFELSQFSKGLIERPHLIVANKMDIPASAKNFEEFTNKSDESIVPISAKLGTNIRELLLRIRRMYDKNNES